MWYLRIYTRIYLRSQQYKTIKMKLIIIILSIIFITSCSDKIKEIDNAFKMVDKGLAAANAQLDKTKNEKEEIDKLLLKIDSTKSSTKIETKERILNSTAELLNEIDRIEQDLLKLHPEEEDEKSYKMINTYMIEKGNARLFKEAISKSISDMIQISSSAKLNITTETLPIKLNLHMEAKGKTWEEYNFSGMPYGATKPIFAKFKNDITLTKLLMLQNLIK